MAHWLDGVLTLLEAETADLTELARLVGADPKTFYRGADFRRADLSDEDISAFDTHGGDLSKASLGELNRAFLESADLADLLLILNIEELPGAPRVSANWPDYEGLSDIVLKYVRAGEFPSSALAHGFLIDLTYYLDSIAKYDTAEMMALAVRNLLEARLPETDRLVAQALANHGVSLQRWGKFGSALALVERAVALHEANRVGSAELARSYLIFGGVLFDQGLAGHTAAFQQAARRFQQALVLLRRLSGRGDEVAGALNNLGAVRDSQGRRAAAARLVGASLKMWRAMPQPGNVRLGVGVMNSGLMSLTAGRADLAEPLLREALGLLEVAYVGQPQHPDMRDSAGLLVSCLVVLAAAGDNTGLREMEARQLCDRYGFEFEVRKGEAMQYPYEPVVR
jgi:tetratricopeptide (TPR) repeat protein